jgi:hypothetical protein
MWDITLIAQVLKKIFLLFDLEMAMGGVWVVYYSPHPHTRGLKKYSYSSPYPRE